MRFSGYWVEDANGKVVIQPATFDETELDPQTNWKEALQNQDAGSPSKGFVETGSALAHAARLIARNQGRDITDVEILALQSAPPLFRDGRCELENLDDLRQLCTLINSLQCMYTDHSGSASVKLLDPDDEIPFE